MPYEASHLGPRRHVRFHHLRWSLALVLLFGIALHANTARAGCPNACTVSVELPSVSPPLDCFEVTSTEERCDCGAMLYVFNHCEAPVVANDFLFTSCGPNGGDREFDCPSVAPDEGGAIRIDLVEAGAALWEFDIEVEDEPHVISVVTDVESFNNGCACSWGPAPAPAPGSLALVLAGVAWFVRRRLGR